jgi:hypothetical protein
MAIQIGGLRIDVPSNPVHVPDASDLLNQLNVGNAISQMSTVAKAGFDSANAFMDNVVGAAKDELVGEAKVLAIQYQKSSTNANFDDCVPLVMAGVAYLAALKGGAIGAAIGAGGGYYAARIACRLIFPDHEDAGDAASPPQDATSSANDYAIARIWNQSGDAIDVKLKNHLNEVQEITIKPQTKYWHWWLADQGFWDLFSENGIKLYITSLIQASGVTTAHTDVYDADVSIIKTAMVPTWNMPSTVTGRIDYVQLKKASNGKVLVTNIQTS